MPGPIEGLRVLDLTAGMAGAICGMLLADYGAEVVKVEPPGGGCLRRAGAGATWDRGKRSLVADLDAAEDAALLRRLAGGADVVIEGLRPGRAEALGLDHATLSAANPGLTFCRLTAYGPAEADAPAADFLAAARLGVMAEMPGHRDGPIAPGSPTLAYSTAMMAAIGILSLVRARLVTGLGDRLEISHEDGFLAQMTMNWKAAAGQSFVANKARTGELDMGRTRLLLRMYECKDGRRVQVHTGAVGAFGRAMEVFGLAGRISPAKGPGPEMASLLTDDDLAALKELPAIFRTRTADEWCELLWAHEVACLPVQAPGVVFNDPQVRHAGVMRRIDDPELGEIEVVGPVLHLSATPGEVRGPPPRLGADGAELRAQGWRSAGLAGEAGAAGEGALDHPLQGVRIVEFSSFFASPYGDRLLADLGAEVIKVEPVAGDLIRPLRDPYEGANRGKRDIAFDLKAPEAREILAGLLARADVVQNNMRPGAAERLGVDYEQARRLNPAVVYDYAPGYGSTGPKAKLQSFAPLLGGFTGLMTLFGGPGNAPHIGFGNEDYFNGQLVAFSILLGLVHRARTGQGQYIEGPQLHSSLLITSEWYLKDGEPCTAMPQLDAEQAGFGPYQRLYQCLDGWLAVACLTPAEQRALVEAVLPGRPADDLDGTELTQALSFEFFGEPVASWIDRLAAAGAPAAPVREDSYYLDYLSREEMVAAGRVFDMQHPVAGPVRGPALMFRTRRYRGVAGGPAPALGADSRAILGELGLGAKAEQLVRAGVVIAADPPPAGRPAASPAVA